MVAMFTPRFPSSVPIRPTIPGRSVFSRTRTTPLGRASTGRLFTLTIRGVTRKATLNVSYLGQWATPWWEDGVNKGPKTRAGFLATTQINRQDFGVSWQDTMDRGGLVVGNEIDIAIDVEAVLEDSSDVLSG